MYKFFKPDAYCPRNIVCDYIYIYIYIHTTDFFSNNVYNRRAFSHIRILSRVILTYIPMRSDVSRLCGINSTRNITKSTNVIPICEKNNEGSSLCRMLRVCTMKMQIRKECVCTCVCTYVHRARCAC